MWRPGSVKVTPWFVKNTWTWLRIDSPGCSTVVGRGPQPIATSTRCWSEWSGGVRRKTRSPSDRLISVVTVRGWSDTFVRTTSAVTYSPTNAWPGIATVSSSPSSPVSPPSPAASTGAGSPGGQAAVAPAEVLPARPHLRVGRVDEGGAVMVRERERGIARIGIGRGREPHDVAGLVHDLDADARVVHVVLRVPEVERVPRLVHQGAQERRGHLVERAFRAPPRR